jgi:very-short-patch-repair endonuclease
MGRNRRPPGADKLGMALSLARRREIRRRTSDAAALLWDHLRGRRLAGFRFRRQHPCRPFMLDFFCPKQRLAIQLDDGRYLDAASLATRGITVLRFPTQQVLRDPEAVLVAIAFALSAQHP